MHTIFLALGLVLIVEGLAWMLAPSLIEQILQRLRDLPTPTRRQIGGLALASGLIFLWIAHNVFG